MNFEMNGNQPLNNTEKNNSAKLSQEMSSKNKKDNSESSFKDSFDEAVDKESEIKRSNYDYQSRRDFMREHDIKLGYGGQNSGDSFARLTPNGNMNALHTQDGGWLITDDSGSNDRIAYVEDDDFQELSDLPNMDELNYARMPSDDNEDSVEQNVQYASTDEVEQEPQNPTNSVQNEKNESNGYSDEDYTNLAARLQNSLMESKGTVSQSFMDNLSEISQGNFDNFNKSV